MGTDIHMLAEYRATQSDPWGILTAPNAVKDDWEKEYYNKEPTDPWRHNRWRYCWYNGRNYNLFGQLADVRNGIGFAGVDLGDGWVPISEPRGLPADLSQKARQLHAAADDDTAPQEDSFWLGYENQSWLDGNDLRNYDLTRTSKIRGVVSLEDWKEWWNRTKGAEPFVGSYSGGISGPKIVTLTQKEVLDRLTAAGGSIVTADETKLYVQAEWSTTYRDASPWFWDTVVPALLANVIDPGNVRLVFGFDS